MTLSHQFFSTQTQLPTDSLDFFYKSTTQLLVNQWLGLVVWDSRDTNKKDTGKKTLHKTRGLYSTTRHRGDCWELQGSHGMSVFQGAPLGGVLRPGSSTTQLGPIEDVLLHGHRIHVWSVYPYLVDFYGKLIDNITFVCFVGVFFTDSTMVNHHF